MSTRAEELAQKLEQANNELLAAVEQTTDEQWDAPNADGEWTQGFTAFHAATSIEGLSGMVHAMADGQPLPPIDMAEIDRGNAELHRQHANPTKAETLEAIRRGGPASVAMVRGLTDDQLDHTSRFAAMNADISVQQLIEMLLIGHSQNHLESITKAR